MKVVFEEGPNLVLKSEGEKPALLNALRRAIISELPGMAVSEVDFYENTSPLYNEYLANRIGLVPLSWDEGIPDDARISLSLNAEAVEEKKTIYSRDLISTDEKIKVFCENIPLVVLGKGHKIRLEAFAVKGTVKEHARFQSAVASFGFEGEFKAGEKCKKCSAPMKSFKPAVGSKNLPDNSFLCSNCEKPDGMGKEFLFTVESFNNLSAREQYARAVEVMLEKTKLLEKEFK